MVYEGWRECGAENTEEGFAFAQKSWAVNATEQKACVEAQES